jgi:hypothetical protein
MGALLDVLIADPTFSVYSLSRRFPWLAKKPDNN